MITPYQYLLMEFGTAENLAKRLKCHKSTVYRWKRKPIMYKWIYKIELESKFKLKRQLLRPDLFQ